MHSLKGGIMAEKDIIAMNRRELKRLHIIHKILDKRLKQVEAKDILDLCERQIRRIVKRIRLEGDHGAAHKSRGKPSHNKIPDKTKEKVINLYKGKYKGFGPLLFSEKLSSIEKIKISDAGFILLIISPSKKQVPHSRLP